MWHLCRGESGSWKTDTHSIWSDTQLSILLLELCKKTPYSLPHLKTHVQTHMHSCAHMDVHARIHTHMHTCTHTYTHAQTRTHTHTHTHTHTLTICAALLCSFFFGGVGVCVSLCVWFLENQSNKITAGTSDHWQIYFSQYILILTDNISEHTRAFQWWWYMCMCDPTHPHPPPSTPPRATFD